jgi:hypothetical protein
MKGIAVVVKPVLFEELVWEFKKSSGTIVLANYSASPKPHIIIRIFYGYDPNVEIHTKVIPEIFNINEIQSKIEHEFIHSIDPTSSITLKNAEDPERREKFVKDYSASPYTARGIGTGKVPIEFNTYMWEVIRATQNLPPNELRDFLKHPDQTLPKALERYQSFIQAMLQDPELRKMFLWKLSRVAA